MTQRYTIAFKKMLAILLCITMLLSLLPVTALAEMVASDSAQMDGQHEHSYQNGFCLGDCYQPCQGSGTESDPYQITNGGNLYWFAQQVNGGDTDAWAVLTHDIQINKAVLVDGKLNSDPNTVAAFRMWSPIGSSWEQQYIGKFDGMGHTISGLYQVRLDEEDTVIYGFAGLFGMLADDGCVQNVGVIGSYISGLSAGGVVNNTYMGGTVTNCWNTGVVSGQYSAGGVVGDNYEGAITDCWNTGTVFAENDAGGVVAYNTRGSIANCWNGGTVSTQRGGAGGIAGYSDGPITNCYNTGAVSGKYNIGGIAGYNYSYVINCYNTGSVYGEFCVGGVTGDGSDTVINCYYRTNCAKVTSGTYQYGMGNRTAGSTTPDVAGAMAGRSDFSTGEVAYLLRWKSVFIDDTDSSGQSNWINCTGSVWGQNIGSDAAPNFSGSIVYKTVDCQNKTVYSNQNESGLHSWNNADCVSLRACTLCGKLEDAPRGHSFQNGFCISGCYQPCEGEGTAENPYRIANGGNLYWFAQQVNGGDTDACAVLTCDIRINQDVLVDGKLNSDENVVSDFRMWTPIAKGTNDEAYCGTFDGKGHTISGLYQNGINGENQYTSACLFDCVRRNGRISNLGLTDSYLCGQVSGGVVSYNYEGAITNCWNAGVVIGQNSAAGGVVCFNFGGTLTNCRNVGAVFGQHTVGGVVGYNNCGTVTNCWNTGTVSGKERVGGIAGGGDDLANCYNTGTVSGQTEVGGIVGCNDCLVYNCYYLTGCAKDGSGVLQNGIGSNTMGGTTADQPGKTEGRLDFTTGEVAYLLSQGTDHDGKVYSGEGWGQTLADESVDYDASPNFEGTVVYKVTNCQGETAYTNKNTTMTHIWGDGNCELLRTCTACGEVEDTPRGHSYRNGFCICGNNQPCQGSGTKQDPFQIANAGNLYWFAQQVNGGDTDAWAILTCDIRINEEVLVNGELNSDGDAVAKFRTWTPIGQGDYSYVGTFDGKEHTISGLYLNGTANNLGLFRYLGNKGCVQNLGLIDSYIKGAQAVGGIAGKNNSGGKILNCYNKAVIEGTDEIGGLVGYNDGQVKGCYNAGTVIGKGIADNWGYISDGMAGGVVGWNDEAVYSCFNTGTVQSNGSAGGIVGYHNTNGLQNCYNEGKVRGGYQAGGVASGAYGEITDCYNTGTVEGASEAGGIVGSTYYPVIRCYNEGSVSGSWSVGGIVGYFYGEYGEIDQCYNEGEVLGVSYVGGIAGNFTGYMRDCYNQGDVCGYEYVGGIIGNFYGATGYDYYSYSVINGYNMGQIIGERYVGGVVGDIYEGTIGNCYYLAGCATDGIGTVQFGVGNGTLGSTTADLPGNTISHADFSTGEVAYLLLKGYTEYYTDSSTGEVMEYTTPGEGWGQNIDNDAEEYDAAPNFEGAPVYRVDSCGKELVYSNTNQSKNHNWNPATCTQPRTCSVCGATDGEPLEHSFGAWVTDVESTCSKAGTKHRVCTVCGYTEYQTTAMADHKYVWDSEAKENKCAVCGKSTGLLPEYPLDPDEDEKIDLSQATLALEYSSVYYTGKPLTPAVTLTYKGAVYDASTQLKITYRNNDRVGTAMVEVEGIDWFTGTALIPFEISYEVIPEQIVNVVAIGDIGKIALAWGESSEVSTQSYRIYRKEAGSEEYQLIQTVDGRMTLTYEDTKVEKTKTYSYYITGVGLYGAESEPSLTVTATVLVDETPPVVLKISPDAASVIAGQTTLSATATDNINVTKVVYSYTVDNGENWTVIGEATKQAFRVVFDTTALNSETVKVKAVAFDAEGNESDPVTVVYSLDNVGPEKVTGLSAVTLSSKITLSWSDVTAKDAVYFILQQKSGNTWSTIANKIDTLGYTVTMLQPDTEYVYRVACIDSHGNIGEYSDAFTARTAADETAPVITGQGPKSNRYRDTVRYSVKANDDCAIASIEIQVSLDLRNWTVISTKKYTAQSNTQTYTYDISLSQYPEGSLFVRGIAKDFTGNVSKTESTAPYCEYIVDRTAPEAPTGVTADGGDGFITVYWDMGSEMDLGKYAVYRAESADGTYQCIASGLSSRNYHDSNVEPDKEYYYQVAVSDTAGNISEYSAVVFATMKADKQNPAITSISSTYQQKISAAVHTVQIAAQDNNKLSELVVEYCTSLDTRYKTLISNSKINSNYTRISVVLPLDGLSDGDNIYLRAYAVDMAGLRSDYKTVKYTLDTNAPTVENYKASVNGELVNLTWNGGGVSDLSGFKVYRSTNGGGYTLIGSRGVNSSGTYTFVDTVPGGESKTYTYKLEAVDKLGNTSIKTATIEYIYVYVNKGPTAKMSIPNYMICGVEERFDASASTDDISVSGYLWDFGDGTTSNQVQPIKRYDAAGTYTVRLTVTDNEGVTSTVSKVIEVKERSLLGTLKVLVTDENGKALSHVPVYFDLGSDDQKIIYTDLSGLATMQLPSGIHTVGMYTAGYLPVKRDAVVLANAVRTVTLKTVEEQLVTGEFEITKMSFEQIVAAGIDVSDPANSNVYSATVKVTYGFTQPIQVNYVRENEKIIEYQISDSNGKPVTGYVNGNGEKRVIAGISYIGGKTITGGSGEDEKPLDVVAIIDIPAEARYLKEFIDVRLHIINNASSEFVLENNQVTLHIPEGLALETSVHEPYSTTETVKLESIKGQETVTAAWILRGDAAGEYDLSADYTGTLAEFDELVTARFETKEPVKIYGLECVKLRVLAADEMYGGKLYFNVELENQRDIDIYMPSIGLTDKMSGVAGMVVNNTSKDAILTEAFLMNAYIQTENGDQYYQPINVDESGNTSVEVELLAPGQKLVYEYVVYNASSYLGTAQFREIMLEEFGDVVGDVEVGTFHREFYSFTDYSLKLDSILYGEDQELKEAYKQIFDSERYYYVQEAEKDAVLNSLGELAYDLFNSASEVNLSAFTEEEQHALAEEMILEILKDSSVIAAVEDKTVVKFHETVTKGLKDFRGKLIDEIDKHETNEEKKAAITTEVVNICAKVMEDSKKLTVILYEQGEEAFYSALVDKVMQLGIGGLLYYTKDQLKEFAKFENEAYSFYNCVGGLLPIFIGLTDGLAAKERDALYFALLKEDTSYHIAQEILDALIAATEDHFMDQEKMIIHKVAKKMRQDLDASSNIWSESWQMISHTVGGLISTAFETLLKKAISATPFGVVIVVVMSVGKVTYSWLGAENYVKQHDYLEIHNALSDALIVAFQESTQERSKDTDRNSMLYLRALCEQRILGENEFASFMSSHLSGKSSFIPWSEKKMMQEINSVFDTDYSDLGQWQYAVQSKIDHARTVLFRDRGGVPQVVYAAPVVTLDYNAQQTVQSFTADYEYCFADGVWKACTGEPIGFELKSTPSVLRVRQAANETTQAGRITTVRIYAQKELSKQIRVKFDGVQYTLENVSGLYDYMVALVDDPNEPVDWEWDIYPVSGYGGQGSFYGEGDHAYALVRSSINHKLMEAASLPLAVKIERQMPLNLVIDGNGTVTQSDSSCSYFAGDSIDLVAQANGEDTFIGWFVNGACVSTDSHYIVEMMEGLEIVAKFTGVKIRGISVEQLPEKLAYYEGEALSRDGMKVRITYADGTTAYAQQFALSPSTNGVGTASVDVTYGGYSDSYEITIDHQESDWILLQDASPETAGEKVITCYACRQIIQTETIPTVAKPAFSGASLTLEDDLTINFKVDKTVFEQTGYTLPYVVFKMGDKEITVSDYRVADGKYIFDFEHINPHQMNDIVSATLYAVYDGVAYASQTREYSVATYCYNMLDRCTGNEYAQLRTLLVDLLNYGTASQEYMSYQVEVPANGRLTAEQKAWGTAEERTLTNALDVGYRLIEDPGVLWLGAGLNLQKSVAMRFKISAEDVSGLTVHVTNDIGQRTILTGDTFEKTDGGHYVFFDGLNAGQMSDIVYLTVYEGDRAVSHTVRYSIESYAYAKQNAADPKLSALVKAMMKYGDAVNAYAN